MTELSHLDPLVHIEMRLRKKFHPLQGWLVVDEVRSDTEQYWDCRRLDFVAWHKKRFDTIGLEVKLTRADYRAEIRTPDKTAIWRDMVDEFYFVVPRGLLNKDDIALLPERCGLLEVSDTRVLTKVDVASNRAKYIPPDPAKGRSFGRTLPPAPLPKEEAETKKERASKVAQLLLYRIASEEFKAHLPKYEG